MTARTLAELEAARAVQFAMTADQLKAWRARMNLSAAGAAFVLGVSVRTYQAWESGRNPVMLTASILAIQLEATGLRGLRGLRPAERALLEPVRAIYGQGDACAAR
jgi:transcriptional regulator with XRE-family HTH domain